MKKNVNRKLTVLTWKGVVSLYDENLREVIVCFKTSWDVSVILIDLREVGVIIPKKKSLRRQRLINNVSFFFLFLVIHR